MNNLSSTVLGQINAPAPIYPQGAYNHMIPAPAKDISNRKLIALVGRNGTGKHTYLEEYYMGLGLIEYRSLATIRSVEQNGIHPRDQVEYVNTLRTSNTLPLPDTFMFVTYSPYILDGIGWEEVHNIILFHKARDRFYRGTMLSHPDWEWASKVLTLGEFWDAEGEAWLEQYGEDVTYIETLC